MQNDFSQKLVCEVKTAGSELLKPDIIALSILHWLCFTKQRWQKFQAELSSQMCGSTVNPSLFKLNNKNENF